MATKSKVPEDLPPPEDSSPKEELEAKVATTFTDKFGTQWDCALDFSKVEAIDNADKSALDLPSEIAELSLLEPTRELLNGIIRHTRFLMFCVWISCRDQAKGIIGIEPEDSPENEEKAQRSFAKRMSGPAIEEARKAFIYALGEFHPDLATGLSTFLRQWELSRKTVARKIGETEGRMTTLLTNSLEQEFDNSIEQAEMEVAEVLSKTKRS
jgi:hypothetical protein